jgi:hypothetical protein
MREDEDKVMNPPNELLRREELIEQASLDALGLLDEFEAAHYARSFHAAPASVQEEIRRLQAAMATDAALLADEEPPADLRAKVMGSVREAMDEEARELKPIATIGSKSSRSSAPAAAELIERERMGLKLRAVERLVSVWRAASVGLAASLVAALVWIHVFKGEMNRVEQLVQNGATSQEIESQLGSGFRALLNAPGRTAYPLAGSDPSVFGALLHVASEDDMVFIFAVGLRANVDYTVRVATAANGNLDLGTFTGGSTLSGCRLNAMNLVSAIVLKVEVTDPTGKVVLTLRG